MKSSIRIPRPNKLYKKWCGGLIPPVSLLTMGSAGIRGRNKYHRHGFGSHARKLGDKRVPIDALFCALAIMEEDARFEIKKLKLV
jgi:hypothetical protein